MDKNQNISDLTDGEFLSFLYAERDREYAISSAWGINYWVVGGAIIGLLGLAFDKISDCCSPFNWRLFTYYAVSLGSILILLGSALSPLLHGTRWKNKYRVTNISNNFPVDEIFWKGFIANASFIFLSVCLHDYGAVFWLYLVLFAVEIYICGYVLINWKKLVGVKRRGFVFADDKWEVVYRLSECVICGTILTIAIYTWGRQYEYANNEFETSCILAIIIGICWLSSNRIHTSKHHSIDAIIDQYLYGTLSKEEAYFSLKTFSQGQTTIEILLNEYEQALPLRSQLKEWNKRYAEYKEMINRGQLNVADIDKYIEDIRTNKYIALQTIRITQMLTDKVAEVKALDNTPETCKALAFLETEINKFLIELLHFVTDSTDVSLELQSFVKSNRSAEE